MREMIAVLDGLGANLNVNASGQYAGGSSWYSGAPTLPSGEWGMAGLGRAHLNVNASGQYAGGSSWYSGAPTLPSGEWGMAGLAQAGALLAEAAQGAQAASSPQAYLPQDPYRQGGIEGDWMEDVGPVDRAEADFSSYLAAFNGPFVAQRVGQDEDLSGYGVSTGLAANLNVNASGQYAGGSSWYSGAPTLPSGEWGLARAVGLRAAVLGAVFAGASPAQVITAARLAVSQTPIGKDAGRVAYESAFRAATAAGYDRQWAHSAASRVAQQAMQMGFDRFATMA